MTQKWQPISMLPMFMTLGEKMCKDTSDKIEKMDFILSRKTAITDKEVAEKMHIFYRQRQNYSLIEHQLDLWKKETSDKSVLDDIEKCRASHCRTMELTRQAEKRIYALVYSTREARSSEKTKGSPNNITGYTEDEDLSITSDLVKKYDEAREAFKSMHGKMLMGGIDQDSVKRSAQRVGIWQNPNGLKINTEHELSFFYDYCMYNTMIDGMRPISISYNKFSQELSDSDRDLFKKACEAYFGYLDVLKPVGEEGVIVYDVINDQERLLIDRGLNNVAKKQESYVLVCNVIDMGGFIMTTGASTPIQIHQEDALKLHRLVGEHTYKKDVKDKDRKQFITDVFKLCFSEDLTDNVTSKGVPHGEGALKEYLAESQTLSEETH